MDISRCLFPTERTLHSSSSCCRRACPIYMECESSDRRNVVRIISISFFFLFSPKFRFPTDLSSWREATSFLAQDNSSFTFEQERHRSMMICRELMNGYWKLHHFIWLVIQVILIKSANSYFTFRYLRIVVCRYARNDKTEIISYVR